MIASIDTSLIDWSRAQFALTAIYHWLFVPLTLGLGIIQAIMETIYYKTGKEFWKTTAQFWMKIFGINFAIGVATGLILEFEFGTNWSNYSWFVGDIFGAPLAIEGVLAFFMEATFIAVMFFGWNKVSKGFHLASTWLTIVGATISAFWILVANAWMQYPTGMEFNPDTGRSEMIDFFAVALSPVATNKFFHTVFSAWIVGAVVVLGISCWYLLKKQNKAFALASAKIAAIFGLVATILTAWTGDGSAYQVAQKQPMKLAAMEGLYSGGNGIGLVGIGVLADKASYEDATDPFVFKIEIPKLLSFFAQRDLNAYVPGIADIINGGYALPNGQTALSAQEKIALGQTAIAAFGEYRRELEKPQSERNQMVMAQAKDILKANFQYFGYGYVQKPADLIPPVAPTFYGFRIMVIFGGLFLLLFIIITWATTKGKLENLRWLQKTCIWAVPIVYITSQTGWMVAELGRQPWAIQDTLPLNAAVSKLAPTSVQVTFFIFLILFTVLLIAELNIMFKAIKKGPQPSTK
jgi:cytochrome d ubiquinol oxidase subunit I